LRVAELFAGVGGFRLGLEGVPGKKKAHNKRFKTVWFNQWEPATKRQHAHEVYVERFGDIDENTNSDIASVVDKVPDHDLLVGGFPCQDYSVARNLSAAKGLVGKKGVLWWSIHDILKKKGPKAPNYLMLENVDRLINSPAGQRGRDFAVILSTLNSLGYMVEWRIINAAEYGMPQRRRRIFIMGYKKGSPIYENYKKEADPEKWLFAKGVVQSEFQAEAKGKLSSFLINKDAVIVSEKFNIEKPSKSPFGSAGISIGHRVYTLDVRSTYEGDRTTLGDILVDEVSDEFYINEKELEDWIYLKGAKDEQRKAKGGFRFTYTEGAVAFPDPLDRPSRTIITGEGGSTPSRFKHVIKTKKGYRRLTPIELEKLSMFPENHTAGHSDSKRAFFMGNALVVGVIDKLGKALNKMNASNPGI
jgi:DNA (cytosine-5)-methyltransferase 1